MADHARFVSLANKLIAKQGRAVGLYKIDKTATDPDTPWKGSGGQQARIGTGDVFAVYVPVAGSELGIEFIDKELLRNCDEVCLIGGSDLPFNTAEIIKDNGVDWKVNWIRELKPADKSILVAYGVSR